MDHHDGLREVYLNGRGISARYDISFPGSRRIGRCQGQTESGPSFSESYKTFLKKSCDAQVIMYEKTSGCGRRGM